MTVMMTIMRVVVVEVLVVVVLVVAVLINNTTQYTNSNSIVRYNFCLFVC